MRCSVLLKDELAMKNPDVWQAAVGI